MAARRDALHDNRHAPRLIRTWADAIGDDDVMVIDGIPVTTPARTALDMACRYPLDAAITASRRAGECHAI